MIIFTKSLAHTMRICKCQVLKQKLLFLGSIWKRSRNESPECFLDLLAVLKSLSIKKRLISNILILAKILLVNAATSSTAERSFSLAQKLKTWTHSTMSQTRFNSLKILNTYQTLTDNIDLTEIGNKFFQSHPRRQIAFGKFV